MTGQKKPRPAESKETTLAALIKELEEQSREAEPERSQSKNQRATEKKQGNASVGTTELDSARESDQQFAGANGYRVAGKKATESASDAKVEAAVGNKDQASPGTKSYKVADKNEYAPAAGGKAVEVVKDVEAVREKQQIVIGKAEKEAIGRKAGNATGEPAENLAERNVFNGHSKVAAVKSDSDGDEVSEKPTEKSDKELDEDAEELESMLAKLQEHHHADLIPAQHLASTVQPSSVSLVELAQILDEHKLWVETGGDAGSKADLSGAHLEGADLTGVNLQGAILTKASLTGSDLSMANLRGANLVHADLRNTTLLGTELRGANLMGATLYGAEGLWVGRLGGTNLFDALLPESIAEFNNTNPIADASKVARLFYFLTLAVSAICALLIVFTSDVRLLLNASAFPGSHTGNVLPMTGFYLGGPLLLFALYLRFHFVLLRLWGSIAALPAVFPDGQTPERDGPWFLMGLIRKHFRWLRDGRSPLAVLETSVSMALGYWVVPATLVLFWMRYLVRQDFRGTLLQVLLITVAVAAATGLPAVVARVLRPGEIRIAKSKNLFRMMLLTTRAALITGGFLLIVSLGVHRGLPADSDIAPEHSSANMRRWASQMFQSVGYRPYADLTEAVISTPPEAGHWNDEGIASTSGARLNQMNLRFARAYRSFLINAKLWRADLEGAYFSEADLRGANLREAELRSANFDRAQANRAVFVSADAVGSQFVSTDLRGADLSYGKFDDADLSNAKLAGASLYSVSMRGARLQRADLSRTDLRDSKLERAVASFANVQEADLSSAKLGGANFAGAQLKGTILLDVDLKNADLHGAFLGGALLRGAELDGVNLSAADLRGATGLSAAQICSARWQGAQLDAELLIEVQGRCGANAGAGGATASLTPPVNSAQPAGSVAANPVVQPQQKQQGSGKQALAAAAAMATSGQQVNAKLTAPVAADVAKSKAPTDANNTKTTSDTAKSKDKASTLKGSEASQAKTKNALAAVPDASKSKTKPVPANNSDATKSKKKTTTPANAKAKTDTPSKSDSSAPKTDAQPQ